MKPSAKKAVKYTLVTLGVALFLFLMLPFLEVPTLSSAQEPNSFVPQIFTTNPLTRLAKRLARVFGKKAPGRATRHALTDRTQPTVTRTGEEMTLARADVANDDIEIEEPANPDEENAQFFLPGEQEDWVLVRQRAPETARSGMHELSVKDNAYDRYIKQERSARYTPAAAPRKTGSVPDSKLARLFNPIKRFFGMNGGTAARSGALDAQATFAAGNRRGSYSDGIGRNTSKQTRQLPSAQDANTAFGTMRAPNVINNAVRKRADRFSDLIDTNQVIQDAADLVAGSVQDPRARERARQQQEDKYNELAKQRLLADLLARGGEEPPQDALPETANCDIVKGMITQTEGLCFPPSYLDEAQQLREENAKFFLEKTGQALPPTQLTPVLGVVDKATLQSLEPTDYDKQDPAVLYTKEIYRFMLNQNQCGANECFWVANTVQTQDEDYQTLQASIIGAGVDFSGDPLHKYETLKNQFVADQVAQYQQQHPQATQEDIEKFIKDVQRAAPPYVLYTKQDLATISQQLKEPVPGHPQPTLYFTAASDAIPFAQTHGFNVPFSYGTQGHQLVTAGEGTTLEQRSRALITDLADNTLLRQQIHRDIQRDAGLTAVANTAAPIVEEIQEQAARELADFAKTSELGKTQK